MENKIHSPFSVQNAFLSSAKANMGWQLSQKAKSSGFLVQTSHYIYAGIALRRGVFAASVERRNDCSHQQLFKYTYGHASNVLT